MAIIKGTIFRHWREYALWSLLLLHVGTSAKNPKVVNGDRATEPYPYYGFFEVGCGASIVAPDMLLTAAHCNYWDILLRRVWLGSTELRNGTRRSVVERFPHPEYRDDSTGEYDIMLMKVNASMLVESDDGVTLTGLEPIALNSDDNVPTASQELHVMGHGRTSISGSALSDNLLEVALFAYDDEVCIEIYNQTAASDPSALMVVPESMFCAGQGPQGFGGTCNGDSGGPVIDPVAGVQVGIVSWGHACSLYGYPSVFGRVSSATDWINDIICKNSCFPDPSQCGDTIDFHPCATVGNDEALSNGTISLNLTIISDDFPGEIAFALDHVEHGLEVYFHPYMTLSNADAAGLDYGEDLIIQQSFQNLPNGTYHLSLGDMAHDGICYGYSNCLDQEKVILSFLETGEIIWTDDGNYFSGTDIYIKFDSEGNVAWISEYPEGVAPPTPAPSEGTSTIVADDFPGDFPSSAFEVMINVRYDSWISETNWYFQRYQGPDSGNVSEIQSLLFDDEWVTVAEGPDGLERGSTLHSYNQSSLQPDTLYRYLFLDSLGDGIYTWGATITNSSASDDYPEGTLLWSLPSSFRTFSEVYLWIDSQGNSEVIEYVKVPGAPFYLGAACSQISLSTELGTNICKDACRRGDCCWNTTSGALCTSYQSECGNYAKCSNLLDLGDETITAEDVSEACRNHATEATTTSQDTLCEVICEAGACCFQSEDDDPCNAAVDCNVYDECSVIFGEEAGDSAVEKKPRRPPY